MTHEYNQAEALRFAPEYERQIREDERNKMQQSGITAKWNEDEQVYELSDGKAERIEAVEFAEWVGKEDLKLYRDGWCQPGG